MKRVFCILLSVAMVLSFMPMVSFADEIEQVEAEPAIMLEEAELLPETEAPEEPEEALMPETPEEPESEPEMVVETEDPGQEMVLKTVESDVSFQLDNDEDEEGARPIQFRGLPGGASGGTVKVTVKMPSGVSVGTGSQVGVTLYKAGVKTGNMISEPIGYWGKTADVSSNTATVTFDGVEAGDYIIYVYPRVNSKDVSGENAYYNADGSIAANEYTATPLTVTSGSSKTVSITLGKASRSISGTIKFTSALSEDTTIRIYAYSTQGNYYSRSYGSQIAVKKGATSASFAIGVDKDTYRLRFNANRSAYYTVNDTLSTEYNQRMYFDLADASVSGLSANGDALFSATASEGKEVSVKITLPETLTADKEFIVVAGSEMDSWMNSWWGTVKSGSKSFTATFDLDLEDGKNWYFYYGDGTDADQMSWENYPGFVYAADSGITTIASNAKIYDIATTSSVEIKWPVYYTVTGTLSRNGFASGSKAAGYVIAESPDGERYADRVVFSESATSGAFKIYIPQSLKGKSFTLYTAPAAGTFNVGIMQSAEKSVGTITLNGNQSAGTVKLEGPALATYSGTVSLPSGMTAPTGGVAVGLRSDDIDTQFGAVVIPAGQKSVSFSVKGEPDAKYITAEMVSPVDGVFYQTRANAKSSGTSLSFPAEAVISGTVYLPDNLTTGCTIEVNADSDSSWSDTYTSMRNGAASSKYHLHVPIGSAHIYAYIRYDASKKLSTNSLYIGSDWKQTTRYEEVTVSGDKSGVDFKLTSNKTVSGKLVSSDAADPVQISKTGNAWLYLYEQDGDDYNSIGDYRITLDENGNWSASVPSTLTGQYIARFSFNSDIESNIITRNNNYYYGSGKVVTSQSEADLIDFSGDKDITGINFYVNTGWVLTGYVCIPENGTIRKKTSDSWSPSIYVYLRDTVNSGSYYGYAKVDPSSKKWAYRVTVPKQSTTYSCYAYGDSEILEYYDTNVALTCNTETVTVQVSGATTIPNLTFPMLKATISGTVYRPEGYTDSFDGNIYIVTSNGSYYASFYLDEDEDFDTYTVSIPDSDSSATYQISYYAWGNGLASGTWYLNSNEQLTQNSSEAADFALKDGTHDFTVISIPPFIQGKIYLPKTIPEDAYLDLELGAQDEYMSYGYIETQSIYFSMNDSKVKSDENGRYINYALCSEYITYETFMLSCTVECDGYDDFKFYIGADGTPRYEKGDTADFTFDGDALTCDFTLMPWGDGKKYVFESGHGLNNETATYTYTYPGDCESITLTFADISNDTVKINGKEEDTTDPVTVTGDTVMIEVTFSGTDRYGFAVTKIKPNSVTKAKSGVAAVYTPDGDDNKSVIDDLKDTQEVSATVCTDGIAAGTKLVGHAALYDKDGRFLGLSKADAFTADDSSNAGLTLSFDEVSEDTVQVTVVVIDADYQPMGDCMTK